MKSGAVQCPHPSLPRLHAVGPFLPNGGIPPPHRPMQTPDFYLHDAARSEERVHRVPLERRDRHDAPQFHVCDYAVVVDAGPIELLLSKET